MSILQLTAVELGKAIQKKQISVEEATRASLTAMQENAYNSVITIDEEGALCRAKEVQRRIDEGTLTGALAGVPIAIKDNLCTKGIKTTCASKMLSNFVPTYTAEAVKRLEDAGAIIIAKTNMDEFAMGSTGETSAYGATINPNNPLHVAGGSSSGSAATVASNACYCALGTDTGGSIRLPSAYCGVTGMKPTYGTVSRYGMVAYASSLDQIGPIAKDVTDCATILETIAGHDAKDATSIYRKDTAFTDALVDDIQNMTIGIPKDYRNKGLEPNVGEAIQNAARLLEKKGVKIEEFDLGLAEYAVPIYYVIASAEASSNLSRFDGVKYGYRAENYDGLHEMYKKSRSQGFGAEVKRRIMLGSFVLSSGSYEAYYLKALQGKSRMKKAFEEAFSRYDIILGPTAPTTAPKLGESMADPVAMFSSDVYTVAANICGLPAISLPCGTDTNGLPIGLQLMGNCFEEKKILRVAYSYERIRNE